MPAESTTPGSQPSELARTVEQVEVSEQQREQILARLTEDPRAGHVATFRACGVAGTSGQIRAWIDQSGFKQELHRNTLEALGGDVRSLLTELVYVAKDRGNSSQFRAGTWLLGLHGVQVKDQTQIEHTGEVRNPDVAAAVERLNQLVAAAALRSAPRATAGELPRGTDI